MPDFLPPDAVRLTLRDGQPVLHVLDEAAAPAADGDWTIVNQPLLIAVDGPGDAGFVLPRLTPAGDLAPDGWDGAVDRAGGSHVAVGGTEVFARAAG